MDLTFCVCLRRFSTTIRKKILNFTIVLSLSLVSFIIFFDEGYPYYIFHNWAGGRNATFISFDYCDFLKVTSSNFSSRSTVAPAQQQVVRLPFIKYRVWSPEQDDVYCLIPVGLASNKQINKLYTVSNIRVGLLWLLEKRPKRTFQPYPDVIKKINSSSHVVCVVACSLLIVLKTFCSHTGLLRR